MSTLLAEQLKAIVDGPLGTDQVTEDIVADRVNMIEQNERHRVFGVAVYRDGGDQYFVNDESTPVPRRHVIETVKADLEANGRLLDERFGLSSLSIGNRQVTTDIGEVRIGEIFKKVSKRYIKVLNKLTGASWRVVSSTDSLFSLDSDESPKRAIDIYWNYDSDTETANIFVVGPKGDQKIYAKQRMKDISRKDYIGWLKDVLSEDIEGILDFALSEEEEEKVSEEMPFEDSSAIVRESLLEELWDIVDEASIVSHRRSTGTNVGSLFERLVRDEDDSVIEALQEEGVPEKHIRYAIRNKEIPYVYAD